MSCTNFARVAVSRAGFPRLPSQGYDRPRPTTHVVLAMCARDRGRVDRLLNGAGQGAVCARPTPTRQQNLPKDTENDSESRLVTELMVARSTLGLSWCLRVLGVGGFKTVPGTVLMVAGTCLVLEDLALVQFELYPGILAGRVVRRRAEVNIKKRADKGCRQDEAEADEQRQ